MQDILVDIIVALSCLIEINGTTHLKWARVQNKNGSAEPLEGVLCHGWSQRAPKLRSMSYFMQWFALITLEEKKKENTDRKPTTWHWQLHQSRTLKAQEWWHLNTEHQSVVDRVLISTRMSCVFVTRSILNPVVTDRERWGGLESRDQQGNNDGKINFTHDFI